MKAIVIASSLLIAVILLLRWLFRGKVSQRLIYGAWLLVALRLLIPIQFGQSLFSVATLTQKVEAQSQPIQQFQQAMNDPVSGPSREELYDQLVNDYLQKNPVPEAPDPPDAPVTPDAPAVPDKPVTLSPQAQQSIEAQVEEQITGPTLSDILTAVWIVGICAMAGWFLGANLLFLSRVKKGAVALERGKIRIRISPNVPTPCLVGFFRPVIYLTPDCAEDEQRKTHVLTHELSHLRHGDHIWALVRCVCLCIYWFNPLVWVAAVQSRRDCELACDESALKKLGDEQRIAYGKTLLNIVTQSMSPVHLLETATAMNETKKQLKERVNFIIKKPKNLIIAVISLLLIAALTAGCVFTGSAPLATVQGSDSPTSSAPPPVNGTVTKPGYKRVYLLTQRSDYNKYGDLDKQYTYTYDEKGLLLTQEYNDVGYPDNRRQITITRNEKDFVSTVSVASYRLGSTGELPFDAFSLINYHNYTYDDSGRLTAYDLTRDGNTTRYSFSYDSLGRLITYGKNNAKYTHFIYDSIGNLFRILDSNTTEYEFTYDSQGRLIQSNHTTYEYDQDGHLIREADGNFDLVYAWENGVLTDIQQVGNNISSLDRSYTLDEFGNVTAITWGDGKRTEFKYTAADLPEKYADRILLYLSIEGPIYQLPNYCKNIIEYYLPYQDPALPSLKTLP